MVFVAEAKAAAAMDTYNTMVNKANSQSKQLKSLLQSQLSLYDNFEAEYAVEQIVQPKLQAVRKAEPVLETQAEPVVAATDDGVGDFADAGSPGPAQADAVAAEVKPVSEAKPSAEEAVSPGRLAGNVQRQNAAVAEYATAQEAADNNDTSVMPDGETVKAAAEVKPAAEVAQEEPARINFNTAAEADAAAAGEKTNPAEADRNPDAPGNGYGVTRKPLFSRFNPRGSMVFNRNGFPRKNADLRVALSELQKTAEPRPQSGETVSEPEKEEVKLGLQNADPKPEENKEA